MNVDLDDNATEEESFTLLVLTQNMLRDILIGEGITPRNSVALSHRVCMSLPDFFSVARSVENSVIDQLMGALQKEITAEIMTRVQQDKRSHAQRMFADIESEIFDRIEVEARSLMAKNGDPLLNRNVRYELSVLRANQLPPNDDRASVVDFTPEIKKEESNRA